MEKRNMSVKIRQRRDDLLGDIQSNIVIAYGILSITLLGLADAKGIDVRVEAFCVYASYFLILLTLALTVDPQNLGSYLMKSARSYVALVLVLVFSFPVRVFLHGFKGYKKYAAREVRRITRMELSRWRERL